MRRTGARTAPFVPVGAVVTTVGALAMRFAIYLAGKASAWGPRPSFHQHRRGASGR
jgi:hypothetical protein